MRLQDETRKCAVFLDHAIAGHDDTLEPCATGFFIEHKQAFSLVAAAHCAREFPDVLGIRLNDK